MLILSKTRNWFSEPQNEKKNAWITCSTAAIYLYSSKSTTEYWINWNQSSQHVFGSLKRSRPQQYFIIYLMSNVKSKLIPQSPNNRCNKGTINFPAAKFLYILKRTPKSEGWSLLNLRCLCVVIIQDRTYSLNLRVVVHNLMPPSSYLHHFTALKSQSGRGSAKTGFRWSFLLLDHLPNIVDHQPGFVSTNHLPPLLGVAPRLYRTRNSNLRILYNGRRWRPSRKKQARLVPV